MHINQSNSESVFKILLKTSCTKSYDVHNSSDKHRLEITKGGVRKPS